LKEKEAAFPISQGRKKKGEELKTRGGNCKIDKEDPREAVGGKYGEKL